jgi:hypothetical protein
MHVDRSWLTVMFVVFGTRWFFAGSALQSGKLIAGAVHFKGSTAIRLFFGIGAPTAFYGAGVVALSSNFKSELWVCVVLAGLGASVIAMWPEEIVTNSTTNSQSRLFGLGKTTIPWTEVDYATENPSNGNIEVAPKEGRKIVHTRLHVGHDDLLAIVRRHCRIF